MIRVRGVDGTTIDYDATMIQREGEDILVLRQNPPPAIVLPDAEKQPDFQLVAIIPRDNAVAIELHPDRKEEKRVLTPNFTTPGPQGIVL